MNKLNIPSPSNGIRLYWDDIEFLNGYGSITAGIIQAVTSITKAYGDNFIVQGCTDLGGGVISAGWIMLDGELLKVDQHTATDSYFEKVTQTNTTGDRDDKLGNPINIYQQQRATATAATGNLTTTGLRLIDYIATEGRAGRAKIATQTLVDAGTNDTDFLTPLKSKNSVYNKWREETLAIGASSLQTYNVNSNVGYISVTGNHVNTVINLASKTEVYQILIRLNCTLTGGFMRIYLPDAATLVYEEIYEGSPISINVNRVVYVINDSLGHYVALTEMS